MSPRPERVRSVECPEGSSIRDRALELMVEHAERGGTVIVGTLEPLLVGSEVGEVGDHSLVVRRRATHAEFLANAPADLIRGEIRSSPFYWEIEVQA